MSATPTPSLSQSRSQRAHSPNTDDPNADDLQVSAAEAPSSAHRIIQAGGRAARQVYDTLELRMNVLVLLDKRTLAVFMRVEQAAIKSVTTVLYREVHKETLWNKMRWGSSRCAAYCDAVRVLDFSPLPCPHVEYFVAPEQAHDRFDAATLTADLTTWRGYYPNLRRVDYLYPADGCADAYVVHLHGAKITVDLESHVQINLATLPFIIPTLPPTPIVEGMTFRHTIALQVLGHNDELAVLWGSDHFDQWKRYLYCNADLDRRVTSIQDQTYRLYVSFEDYMSFISHRNTSGAEPIAKFYIICDDGLTTGCLLELSNALPPGLRVLRFETDTGSEIHQTHKLHTLVDELDRAHPRLHELRLPYSPAAYSEAWSSTSSPLVGMSSLRKLIIDGTVGARKREIAQWLGSFGGEGCALQYTH